MKRYWRIALVVLDEYLEEFEACLDLGGQAILAMADEAREEESASLWLFKDQKWDEEAEPIKQVLNALNHLPEYGYLYLKKLLPRERASCNGSLLADKCLRTFYTTNTGDFFEDINF